MFKEPKGKRRERLGMEIGNMGYNVNAYRGERMDNNRKTEQTIDYSSFDIRVGRLKGSVIGSSMYRQAMDGRKILGLFDSHTDKYFNPDKAKEPEDGEKEIEESTTDTDIIVKADGSRVLVVTTSIAGMSISRSLKISEPTKTPNEDREVNEMEEKDQDVRSGNKGAGDFTAGSEWNDTHAGGV